MILTILIEVQATAKIAFTVQTLLLISSIIIRILNIFITAIAEFASLQLGITLLIELLCKYDGVVSVDCLKTFFLALKFLELLISIEGVQLSVNCINSDSIFGQQSTHKNVEDILLCEGGFEAGLSIDNLDAKRLDLHLCLLQRYTLLKLESSQLHQVLSIVNRTSFVVLKVEIIKFLLNGRKLDGELLIEAVKTNNQLIPHLNFILIIL